MEGRVCRTHGVEPLGLALAVEQRHEGGEDRGGTARAIHAHRNARYHDLVVHSCKTREDKTSIRYMRESAKRSGQVRPGRHSLTDERHVWIAAALT